MQRAVTVQKLIDDLTVLTEALNVKQVGHGAGGILAMLIDIYGPGKLKTVTLLSVPVFLSLSTAEKFTAYRKDLTQGGSVHSLAEYLIGNVTLQDPASAEVKKLYESFFNVLMDTHVEYWDGFIEIHKEIVGLFKRNKKPVLIMTGDMDPLYPPHMSGLHTSYIPNSRYLTLWLIITKCSVAMGSLLCIWRPCVGETSGVALIIRWSKNRLSQKQLKLQNGIAILY